MPLNRMGGREATIGNGRELLVTEFESLSWFV